MPEKPQVVTGEIVGTFPTTVKDGLCRLICQIGQGVGPDPPMYRLPVLSPVSPSTARGRVIRVVKVAFCGNLFASSLSSSAKTVENAKPIRRTTVHANQFT